ncbi:DUF1295 domain-containing protein [Variovorax sp. OV329]|uniref:DUF1295 domain-containing protein n=1 Tax=Variovorax sp. OV329 TaxID=1882825 RepID=UPI0008E5D3EA|nr:DUF1295 domain-containing protein [Variovorax sp. OV329]SFN41700.1 Steroid 5-alpha reductase family enzyme [Variovorax sp. OV329]
MTEHFGLALYGLAASGTLALLAWAISLRLRDVSLVDPFWPFMIAGAGLAYALCLPAAPGARGWLVLALSWAWALRLGIHLAWRKRGHGEDRRYQAIRARNEPGFALKSLYLVFGLQAVLAWCVSAPLGVAQVAGRSLNALDAAGAALALFGVVFEGVADRQLSRFRADAARQGQVMDRGLWRYSRHPNYFGEACMWWGLGLVALAGGGWAGAWSLVSPLLMTVLLLRVSGVVLLEADMAERHGAYGDYVARTPAFVPGRPRRGGRR